MNRRNFLKRLAAVAAGSAVVPTVLSSKQTYTIGVDVSKVNRYVVLPCLHETHRGKPGDRITCRYCGRHYIFMKMEALC